MKRVFRKVAVALGMVLMGTVLTLQANAACGILDGLKPGASLHPQSFEGGNSFEGASCWRQTTTTIQLSECGE